MVEPKYKRILIKLSGEALAGERGVGIDIKTVQKMALEIKELLSSLVEATSGVENLQQKQVWIAFKQITLECLEQL